MNVCSREETRWVTYFRKCLLRAIDRKVGRRDSIKVFLDRLELESSNAQLSPALKDNLDKTAVFIAIVSTSYLHPESRCNLERKYFLASLGDAPEKHAGRVWIILIEEMPSVRWREAFFPDLRATVFYEKDVDDRVRLPMPGTDAKVDQRFLDRIEDLAQGIALSLKELMIRPPAPSRFTSHALTTPINPSRPQVSTKPLRRPLRAFLCHTSHDKMAVRELYQKLIHDDFFVWFDEENLLPGQQWDTEIRKAVRESDVVVACLSRSSITKEGYVQKEIRYALDVAAEKPEGTIFLIPARLDECDVPPGLQALQWVDLYNDKGYERLLKALRKRGEEFGLSVPAMDNLPLAVRGEERVDNAGLNQLQITSWSELPPKSKPEVFVSYAWGMILRTMHESVRKSLIGFVRHSAKRAGISSATAKCCAQAN